MSLGFLIGDFADQQVTIPSWVLLAWGTEAGLCNGEGFKSQPKGSGLEA